MMDEAARRLVVKALTCTLSNCVEWINDKTANRIRSDPANQGLRPGEIIRLLREFVRASGPSCVEQKSEERELWKDRRDYWYRVVIPVPGFPNGLFIEMELLDDDPDVPVVVLLNAHPQLD
jgi:hypothetical protein